MILVDRMIEKSKSGAISDFYNHSKINYLVEQNIPIRLESLSIHRLIITAVNIVQKFYSDKFYSSSYCAKVGGLELKELNLLEEIFVKIIDWEFLIKMDDYNFYHSHL
jgi:hypothetical protein